MHDLLLNKDHPIFNKLYGFPNDSLLLKSLRLLTNALISNKEHITIDIGKHENPKTHVKLLSILE